MLPKKNSSYSTETKKTTHHKNSFLVVLFPKILKPYNKNLVPIKRLLTKFFFPPYLITYVQTNLNILDIKVNRPLIKITYTLENKQSITTSNNPSRK